MLFDDLDAVSWIASISVGLNAALAYLLYKAQKAPKKKLDITAQDLLHDLTKKGAAVISIQVIDPEHLFLRRS